MRRFAQKFINVLSRLVLWKYKPTVIGITGSVGKTSSKEAVFAAISSSFRARRSQGNFNNEFGVPFTILGVSSPGKNPFKWIWVLCKAFILFVLPVRYPEVLVLEMGADRPGDIEYLAQIAKPHIAVVTAVGPSHLEYFKKVEKIAQEKSKLVTALQNDGVAVLNFDDELVQGMSVKHKGKVLFYGMDRDADIFATDVRYKSTGTIFKVHYAGNVVPVSLLSSLGKPNIYAALAAIAVGISLGMNLVDIAKGLESYRSERGRLRIMPGVKKTILIDDSYNSAPASSVAAIEVLKLVAGKRKIAVLGDMAELGEYTEDGHRTVGAAVVDAGVNILVTVGPKAKFIADQAKQMGFPEKRIVEYVSSESAQKPVENLIEPGDAILIKGSRSMRMEKIVKEIMSQPHLADKLLVK